MGGGQGKEVAGLQASRDAMVRAQGVMSGRVTTLESQQYETSSALGTLRGMMENEKGAKQLATRNEARLGALDSLVSTHTQDISSLRGDVSQNRSNISANTTAISYLKQDVEQHTGQIRSLEVAQANTERNVAVLEGSFNAHAAATDRTLEDHTGRLRVGELEIASTKVRVTGVEEKANKNEAGLATLSEGHAQLRGRTDQFIQTAVKTLDDHEDRLRLQETEMTAGKVVMEHMGKELVSAQQQIAETAVEVGTVKEEVGILKATTGKFIDDTEKTLEGHDTRLTGAEVSLAAQGAKADVLDKNVERAQDHIHRNALEMGNVKEVMGLTTGQLNAAMKDIEFYKKVIMELVGENTAMKQMIAELKQTVGDMQRRQESSDLTVAKLEMRLDQKYKD